jgi:hypothetical protein
MAMVLERRIATGIFRKGMRMLNYKSTWEYMEMPICYSIEEKKQQKWHYHY